MKRFSVVLFVLLFVLAACGGGQPATQPAQAPAEEATEAPAAPAEDTDAEASAEDADAEASTEDTDAEASTEDADAEVPTEDTDDEAPSEDADAEALAISETAKTFVIVPEESKVSYAVGEVFIKDDNKFVTAIGVTQQIEGEVYYDPENPQNSTVGTITIDISAFKSDSDRRDNAIRDKWLESTKYPLATFVPTSIEGLPETYTDGEEMTIQITGDLTVRETTSETTFETTGSINGNEMVGTATTMVQMTDFGFEPPDILGVLKAENDVTITFEFVARSE